MPLGIGRVCFVGRMDPLALFPTVITAAYTWAIWQPNLTIFRAIMTAIPAGWFCYNLHVKAYVAVATSVFEFASAAEALIRLDLLRKSVVNHKNS